MTREELLARLGGLRQARVGQVRVPHKPLLLLWLFGQFAATGSSAASYQRANCGIYGTRREGKSVRTRPNAAPGCWNGERRAACALRWNGSSPTPGP